MKKVDFCESNFALGTDKIKETLEKDGSVEVNVHGCLGYCGECFEGPFALVDGELVSAETPEDLLDKIKK